MVPCSSSSAQVRIAGRPPPPHLKPVSPGAANSSPRPPSACRVPFVSVYCPCGLLRPGRAEILSPQHWAQDLATLGIVTWSPKCPQSHAKKSPQFGSVHSGSFPTQPARVTDPFGSDLASSHSPCQLTCNTPPRFLLAEPCGCPRCQVCMACDRTMAGEEERCRPRGAPGLWALTVGTRQGLCIHSRCACGALADASTSAAHPGDPCV